MEDYLVFEDTAEYEPSKRMYAPLPLEYYKEMRFLTDEEFGRLVRILLHFNLTGKVLPGEGVLCHYVDRVIGRQIRFYRDWEELTEKRKKAGQKSAESRRKKKEQTPVDGKTEPFVEQNQHVLKNTNYTNSDSNSNSDSNTNSDSNPSVRGAGASGTDPVGYDPYWQAPAPGRGQHDVGNGPEAPVADAMVRLLGVRPSKTCLGELREFVSRLGTDTCIFAVERAAEEGRANWSYVRGILRDLDRNRVTDRRQAEESHRRHNGRPMDKNGMYATHGQTKLSELELQAIAEAMAEDL